MKYYIKTFGCQMNVSDSERIAGFLDARPLSSSPLIKGRGLTPAEKIEEADIIIFNTCGVRQTAENRVYGQIHNLKKTNPRAKIIVTGCLANRPDVQKKLNKKVDLFVAINDLKKIENLLEIGNWKLEIPTRNKLTAGNKNNFYLSITPKYSHNHKAYVPIMTGCNNFCSYCVVPYARGQEISRSPEDILQEIKGLVVKNYLEITLLGQNVNSYCGKWIIKHKGKSIFFPELLNKLAQTYPKIKFNFITSHPKDFSEELIKVIAKNKNINRKIHLPIQSGSNKILKAMNRPYTKKQYLNLLKKIRQKIPEVSFTTDVIVGFPGETQKDFLETAKVFKKVNYSEAYINKYSPRPGTAAYKLGDPIPWEEKKRRAKALREIIKTYSNETREK